MRSYRRKDYAASSEKFWNDALDVYRKSKDKSKRLSLLSEMAIPLKIFIRDIEGLKFQIIQNWCLCKWCQLFNPENDNFNHWKEELAAHILQLQNSKLKGKISKRKQLQRYLVEYYEYNDKDVVVGAIRDKFAIEKIYDKKQIDVVASSFAKNIGSLIDVISSPNMSIMSYLSETFGN